MNNTHLDAKACENSETASKTAPYINGMAKQVYLGNISTIDKSIEVFKQNEIDFSKSNAIPKQ